MAQKMTKDQQWKTVIEGLAAGCVAIDASGLPSGLELDFAFRKAWGSWQWASTFPSVVARDFRIYRSKSPRRTMVTAAFKDGKTVEPYLLESYEWRGADDVLKHLGELGPIPANGWLELARLLAAALKSRSTTS